MHWDSEKLFPIAKQNIRKQKTSLDALNGTVKIPVLLCVSECRTITIQMKKRRGPTEIWFYRTTLKIIWTEHMRNEDD